MKKLKETKLKKTEVLLNETISLIKESLGSNPFIDLEKSLEIIKHRNHSQFPFVKKKVGETIMTIYGDRFQNVQIVIKKLDSVYLMIDDFI